MNDPDQVLFLIKWWKEFLLGIGAFMGIVVTIRKGQRVPITVTLTPEQIDQKMELCRLELKNEIHDDIREILQDHKEDLLSRIELMIKASKNNGANDG